MLKNRGFSLIEMLFCLAIILTFSLFSLRHTNISTTNLNHLLLHIEQAQSYALNHKENVYLHFDNQTLEVYTDEIVLSSYMLDKASFYPEQELYFNEAGHVNHATTIYIEKASQTYQLIFNLGTGRYYIQTT